MSRVGQVLHGQNPRAHGAPGIDLHLHRGSPLYRIGGSNIRGVTTCRTSLRTCRRARTGSSAPTRQGSRPRVVSKEASKVVNRGARAVREASKAANGINPANKIKATAKAAVSKRAVSKPVVRAARVGGKPAAARATITP